MEISCDSWAKGHVFMDRLLEINHQEVVMASETLLVNTGVCTHVERKSLLNTSLPTEPKIFSAWSFLDKVCQFLPSWVARGAFTPEEGAQETLNNEEDKSAS